MYVCMYVCNCLANKFYIKLKGLCHANSCVRLLTFYPSHFTVTTIVFGEIYPTNAHKQFIIVLINFPTCFGFQVPSSGGYNFLIYKPLQFVYKV
jgi:hypothetical protein